MRGVVCANAKEPARTGSVSFRAAASDNREVHMAQDQVNVRYMVNDVQESVLWYTAHLGFEEISNVAPAFADVKRGALRLLLSGEKSSAGRPMPDGQRRGRAVGTALSWWWLIWRPRSTSYAHAVSSSGTTSSRAREDRRSFWKTHPAM